MGKPAINGGSSSKPDSEPCRWINTLVTFTNFCIIITKGPTFGFSIKSRKVSIWVDSFQKKLGFCPPNMKTVGIAIFFGAGTWVDDWDSLPPKLGKASFIGLVFTGKMTGNPENFNGKSTQWHRFSDFPFQSTKKMWRIFCRPERSWTGWIERPPTGWCRLLREKLEGQVVF